MYLRFGPILALTLMLAGVTGSLAAQEVTATIVGQVTDSKGAALGGARVIVTDTSKRLQVKVLTSDRRGEFTATLLPVGTYAVRVMAVGFKSLYESGIELHAGDRQSLSLALSPGGVQEQVTVNANALQPQTQTAASDELISGAEIRELSINNRNFLGLLQILPGVTNTSGSDELTIGAVNPTGAVNQLGFSLNGGRVTANSMLLDGSDNLDRGANATLINTPSADAIEEFKVIRGVYSAQYGRNASGQVNVITRSGSSLFHGEVYEFFRNDVLAANNALNKLQGIARPPLRYNDFGGAFGGPVFIPNHYNAAKNRTFFFLSEEVRRVITYPTQSGGLVPSAALKAGTFTHPVCTLYVDAAGTSCAPGATSTTITTFDPVAAEYLKDVFNQLPNGDPATYALTSTGRSVYNMHQEFARFDLVISSRHTLTARYLQDTINTVEPYGYQVNATMPKSSTSQTQSPGFNAMVRLTSVLRPTLLNEAAFAFTSGRVYSVPIGLLAKSSATDVQVNLPFPGTVGFVPGIAIGGLKPIRSYGAYDDRSRNYNFFDDVTFAVGRHTLKAGATYNYYQKTENAASGNGGLFSFTSTPPTGTTLQEQSFADFLLGTHATFQQTSLDLRPDIRQSEAEFYVQDDFRWLRNLTINAGIRYSIFRLPYDNRNMLSNFDPAKFVTANEPQLSADGRSVLPGTGDPLNGIIVNNATSPYGSKVASEPGGRFSPRFGFAWSPFRNGKTAVRGGYGLVFDSTLVGMYENNVFTNPPYLNNLLVSNTTFANPSAGLTATSIASLHGTPLPSTLPYTQEYSFDIQQEVAKSFLMDVGYYGSKGTHLLGIVDINTLRPGQYAAIEAANGTPNTAALTSGTANLVNRYRPYPGYASINAVENWFGSNYNSLQVSAQKNLANGSLLRLAYTWQKTMTDSSTDRNTPPQDRGNIRQEYGLASFNRSQIFVGTIVYKIPFLAKTHGVTHAAFYGWELAGTASFDSGLPVPVLSGDGLDTAQMGVLGGASIVGNVGLRPDRISDPNLNAPHTLQKWFNTAAFREVPSGQLRVGNAKPASLIGPGFQQWDISLFRNVKMTQRFNLQARVESFNTFNHTNPQGLFNVLGASFGSVAGVREPRRIQLGIKVLF